MKSILVVSAVLAMAVMADARISIRSARKATEYDTVNIAGLSVPTVTPNVSLSMDCVLAVSETVGERFPVLVFPNSWDMPQIEYIVKIHQLAKKGYIACEYETRGWWFSEGQIDTAGKLDRQDTTSVIEFIQAKYATWQINRTNFAFMGISYGAGISLLAAGQNPDVVTTAVSMSGWGKLWEGFYYHDTPNNSSLLGLLNGAEKLGRPADSLKDFYRWIINQEHMPTLWEFMKSRSPELLFMDTYKKHNTPIFLSDNQGDHYFFPQAKAQFYDKLPGPKFQLINQGEHAIPEAIGLTGLKNYIWEKAELWVDYWTKGINNGIMSEPPLQIQDSNTMWGTNYTKLASWGDKKLSHKKFYMNPAADDLLFFQTLSTSKPFIIFDHTGTIKWFINTTLGFGWPLQELKEFVGIDPSLMLLSYKKGYDLLFLGPKFAKTTAVCGTPNVTLTLVVPSNRKWQLYGITYLVHDLDITVPVKKVNISLEVPLYGNILGDFQVTYWGNYNTTNETSIRIPDADITPAGAGKEKVVLRNINCRTICHTFPNGTQFAMGFTLNIDHYSTSPDAKEGLEVGIYYGENSFVDMPYLDFE